MSMAGSSREETRMQSGEATCQHSHNLQGRVDYPELAIPPVTMSVVAAGAVVALLVGAADVVPVEAAFLVGAAEVVLVGGVGLASATLEVVDPVPSHLSLTVWQ